MDNVNLTGMGQVATWVGSHMKPGTWHANIVKAGNKVAMKKHGGIKWG
jgi:hypothetical protein